MTIHLKVTPNIIGRDFVIGDLHGMYEPLQNWIDQEKFNPVTDRLFSVGDLIDRGPDSIKCLELLDQNWFYAVQGNHERFMIDSLLHNLEAAYSSWLINGGSWTLEENEKELVKWAERLDQLPVTISIEQEDSLPIGIVHAEFHLDHWDDRLRFEGVNDHEITPMLWSRSQIKNRIEKNVQGVAQIYCGHTPIEAITKLGNCIFIDLGCYNTNELAFIELKSE